MPAPPELPAAATATVRRWMAAGNVDGYLALAGLRHREVPDNPGSLRLPSEERYHRRQPDLARIEHLAGPTVARPWFDRLTDAAAGAFVDDPGGGWRAALHGRVERAGRSGDLVDQLLAWQLALTDAAAEELPAAAAEIHAAMTALGVDTEPDARPMAHAGLHLFRQAPELVYQIKLITLLLQADHDPRLAQESVAQLTKQVDAGETAFGASQALFDGIMVGDAYLGPLLGALTPYVWAFSAHRALGVLVCSFGEPLTGTRGDAAELLQMLPARSADTTTPRPELPAGAGTAALDWWTSRLNVLFGHLSDPALATDRASTFHAPKQVHNLLTVEQLFRRVTSIQTSHRDGSARRALLFTVLDTLDRLTGRHIVELCSEPFARRCLDELTEAIPAAAAPVLLPAARRAVDALKSVQSGFFVHRGGDGTVEVAQRDGTTKSLPLHTAAVEYLKMRRDATHGHGAKSSARVETTNALLALHDGLLDHDLALLGYLYLLRILAHPEDLARRLYQGGAV